MRDKGRRLSDEEVFVGHFEVLIEKSDCLWVVGYHVCWKICNFPRTMLDRRIGACILSSGKVKHKITLDEAKPRHLAGIARKSDLIGLTLVNTSQPQPRGGLLIVSEQLFHLLHSFKNLQLRHNVGLYYQTITMWLLYGRHAPAEPAMRHMQASRVA